MCVCFQCFLGLVTAYPSSFSFVYVCVFVFFSMFFFVTPYRPPSFSLVFISQPAKGLYQFSVITYSDTRISKQNKIEKKTQSIFFASCQQVSRTT